MTTTHDNYRDTLASDIRTGDTIMHGVSEYVVTWTRTMLGSTTLRVTRSSIGTGHGDTFRFTYRSTDMVHVSPVI